MNKIFTRFAIIDESGAIRQINESTTIPDLPDNFSAIECEVDITVNDIYDLEKKEWRKHPSQQIIPSTQEVKVSQTDFNQLLIQQIIDLHIKIDTLGIGGTGNGLV